LANFNYICQIFEFIPLNNNLENSIKELISERTSIKTEEIIGFLQKIYPNSNNSTLRWRLYDLKNRGILKQAGRGVYSLNRKADYQPELSPELKGLYKTVLKSFPYISFCVWDSNWFNEFMVHQAFKRYYVVEVEKEAVESVFYKITEKNKNVFFNPQKDTFDKYILNSDVAIIVISLISESPLLQMNKIIIPSLEKLIVDCIVGDELYATQQNDIEYILQSTFERYNINPAKIKRYASRRNIKDKVVSYLSKYSANFN